MSLHLQLWWKCFFLRKWRLNIEKMRICNHLNFIWSYRSDSIIYIQLKYNSSVVYTFTYHLFFIFFIENDCKNLYLFYFFLSKTYHLFIKIWFFLNHVSLWSPFKFYKFLLKLIKSLKSKPQNPNYKSFPKKSLKLLHFYKVF